MCSNYGIHQSLYIMVHAAASPEMYYFHFKDNISLSIMSTPIHVFLNLGTNSLDILMLLYFCLHKMHIRAEFSHNSYETMPLL